MHSSASNCQKTTARTLKYPGEVPSLLQLAPEYHLWIFLIQLERSETRQTIQQCIEALQELVKTYEFKALGDRLIRSCLVIGTVDDESRARRLRGANLDLPKALPDRVCVQEHIKHEKCPSCLV